MQKSSVYMNYLFLFADIILQQLSEIYYFCIYMYMYCTAGLYLFSRVNLLCFLDVQCKITADSIYILCIIYNCMCKCVD